MTKRNIPVTFEMLQLRFDKPLCDVAKELGVCMTFIKKACRKHGIKRWPFRKVQAIRNRQERIRVKDPAGVQTPTLMNSAFATMPQSEDMSKNPFLAGVTAAALPSNYLSQSAVTQSYQSWENSSLSSDNISTTVGAVPMIGHRRQASTDSTILSACYESPRLPPQMQANSHSVVKLEGARGDSPDSTSLASSQWTPSAASGLHSSTHSVSTMGADYSASIQSKERELSVRDMFEGKTDLMDEDFDFEFVQATQTDVDLLDMFGSVTDHELHDLLGDVPMAVSLN